MMPPSSPSTPWSGNFSWMNCSTQEVWSVNLQAQDWGLLPAGTTSKQGCCTQGLQAHAEHSLLRLLVSVGDQICGTLVGDLTRLVCSLLDHLRAYAVFGATCRMP